MKNPTPPAENKNARLAPHPGAPESPGSLATFPERTKRPGRVGLANEARPGLGTRGDEADPGAEKMKTAGTALVSEEVENAPSRENEPHPPEPQHSPAEQDSSSLAQEEQRSTGVSGQSSGT